MDDALDGRDAAPVRTTVVPGLEPPRHVLDSPEATQRVVRGGILRTATYFASLLAGIAALPLLFRHLGVVDAGRYATVLSLTGIVTGIVENGLSAISVREYSLRDGGESDVLMRELIGLRMGLFTAAAGISLGFLALAQYPAILIAGAAIALVGAAVESLASVYAVWLSTQLRLGAMAAMQLLRNVLAAVLTIVFVLLGAPLIDFFLVLVVAGFAQLALALWSTRGAIPHLPSRRVGSWWGVARASLPYVVAMALGVIYLRVAMLLMALLTSDDEVGYFGVPFRVLEIVTLVSVLSLSSAFPILARAASNDPARHRYALRRLVEVATIIGVWIGIVALIGAAPIVHILAGPKFDPSIEILQVLSISLAAKFLIAAWAFALLSLEAFADVLIANAVALVVAILLTLVLVPSDGGVGGAVSIAAADATLLAGYGIALRRNGYGLAMPGRAAITILGGGAAAAGIALALPLPDVVRALVATAIYAAVLLRLGVIPSEITAMLPGRRRTAAAAV
jgi:O-antigen/teichoic acid export membrane protein